MTAPPPQTPGVCNAYVPSDTVMNRLLYVVNYITAQASAASGRKLAPLHRLLACVPRSSSSKTPLHSLLPAATDSQAAQCSSCSSGVACAECEAGSAGHVCHPGQPAQPGQDGAQQPQRLGLCGENAALLLPALQREAVPGCRSASSASCSSKEGTQYLPGSSLSAAVLTRSPQCCWPCSTGCPTRQAKRQALEQAETTVSDAADLLQWANLVQQLTNRYPKAATMVLLDLLNEPDSQYLAWDWGWNTPGATQLYLQGMDAIAAVNPCELLAILIWRPAVGQLSQTAGPESGAGKRLMPPARFARHEQHCCRGPLCAQLCTVHSCLLTVSLELPSLLTASSPPGTAMQLALPGGRQPCCRMNVA